MYPSIPSSSSAGPPTGQSSGASYYPAIGQGNRPAWPHPSRPPPQPLHNGPVAEPDHPSENHPAVSVQIAEPFRTGPPVMIGGSLEDIPRSQFDYDFTFEKQVIADADKQPPGTSGASRQGNADDPLTKTINRYTDMGYTFAEVSLALTAFHDEPEDQEKIISFINNYRELQSMGFPSEVAVGALIVNDNNLEKATDACISVR